MVFHWSLSDSKCPQVSRTRLRILAVLSNAVIWIVPIRSPTSKSSRPFNNPFVIVPEAPITIGTIVTFMFHSFFNSIARSRYWSFFSHSFRFILWLARTAKSTILQILLFFYSLPVFLHQLTLVLFNWNLSDRNSHHLPRTVLRILANLYNALVWMVSIFPLGYNFSSFSFKPFETVLSASITIGITVRFIFHTFFVLWQSLSLIFRIFSPFITVLSAGTAKSTRLYVLFFFLLMITWSGFLAEIRRSVSFSKSQRILCIFSLEQIHICGCQISISCSILIGSLFQASLDLFCTPFALVGYICFQCNKLFHHFLHIIYSCNFFV